MMLPNTKNHACQSVHLDVLSSLPENVIDDILVHVPLRDAVRTSILSTKWRHKWRRIPQLKLDETLWETRTDRISTTIKFTNIFYHLLTFHAGPISKFILSLILEDFPEVHKLIYFLSKKDVQHLDLRLFVSNNPYNLPSSIFTCLQLRHLSLHGCSIQLARPTFKGFDMLISLELQSLTISSEILESLISSCPLLEQLLLRHIDYSGVIEINAPKLRSFDFVENIGSVCLKSVPRLAKLSLWHTKYHVGIGNCFKSFSSLKYLELNACCLKFVAAVTGEVPTRLPFDLDSVKHLCLNEINLEELDEVLCILRLIRSFQYLQYFEISQEADYNDDSQALECLEVEAFSDVTFNHLRKVQLFHTVGSNPEMQLIKLLLAKSPMLKEMLIFPLDIDEDFSRIEFPIMINSFRRASPEVEVIYSNYG